MGSMENRPAGIEVERLTSKILPIVFSVVVEIVAE